MCFMHKNKHTLKCLNDYIVLCIWLCVCVCTCVLCDKNQITCSNIVYKTRYKMHIRYKIDKFYCDRESKTRAKQQNIEKIRKYLGFLVNIFSSISFEYLRITISNAFKLPYSGKKQNFFFVSSPRDIVEIVLFNIYYRIIV